MKRELETAEEFHLSQLTRPELSFEELELLVSLAERGSRTRGEAGGTPPDDKQTAAGAEAESFIFAGKKRIFQKYVGAFEPEKKRPRKPSGFYGSDAGQIIPAVQKMEQMNGGDLENARILGEQLLDMWKNQKGNRLCLLYYDDQEIPDAVRNEFRKAGVYEPAGPGLYWREDRAEKTVYERILMGCFRENGREGTQSTDGKFI
ncbi:MAG: hypothetical protein V8S12_00205 [Lachnospiraceae bacterium]